mmetsp:Transcript_13835/g.31718  ORF Transcript_13835/g.31718 Transcript_13835/m.31718 type:complete len:215 (-) Transcript_13835:16-660(-)
MPAGRHSAILLISSTLASALLHPVTPRTASLATKRHALAAMEFGKGFGSYYSGWDNLCKEYPEIDRTTYPALFRLPDQCYEVELDKPLGIAFEEGDNGGVVVDFLVEGGNAEQSGAIKPGDVLLATTACMGRDGTFERKLIPSRYLDFDTIMGAIGSNEAKFSKKRTNDVILQFARPGAPYEDDGDPYAGGSRGIKSYMKSLEFPVDSPWRRAQ